ncbi:MAG: hypothetical protein AAFQ89_14955 [Cyanobacteria bacterium J06626_18]
MGRIASLPSCDMRRISTLDIGAWTHGRDQLRLERSDILSLRSLLRIAKLTTRLMSFLSFLPIGRKLNMEDRSLTSTVEAILDFIETHPEMEAFTFQGKP